MSNFVAKRKELEFQLKRNLIIDAAKELFYEKGYYKVTLEEIAKRAGYTTAALYTYIKGKDELYQEIFYIGGLKKREYFKRLIDPKDNGYQQLRKLLTGYFDFYHKHKEVLQHELFLSYYTLDEKKINEKTNEKLLQNDKEVSNLFYQAFTQGKLDGSINKNIDMDRVITQIIYAVRKVASKAAKVKELPLISEQKYDMREWFIDFLNLLLASVKA